jgi:transposase
MKLKSINTAAFTGIIVIGISASMGGASSGSHEQPERRAEYGPRQAMSYGLGSKFMSGYFIEQATQCPVNLMIIEKSDLDSPLRRYLCLPSGACRWRARARSAETVRIPLKGIRSRHSISPPHVDDRRVVSGIIHVIRNGLRWRDAPEVYGPHKTLYNRSARWSRMCVFARIFSNLVADDEPPDCLMIDSTHVKAHRTVWIGVSE